MPSRSLHGINYQDHILLTDMIRYVALSSEMIEHQVLTMAFFVQFLYLKVLILGTFLAPQRVPFTGPPNMRERQDQGQMTFLDTAQVCVAHPFNKTDHHFVVF